MLRVLGIVVARGGSKGIPRKNIRLLNGRPLLEYTARSALAATRLARTILSTEDEEIAEIGRNSGLDVPFRRPMELARDDTPSLPVVQHAVCQLEAQGDAYDAICLLQPTHPLRPPELIDACIELLEQTSADSVFSMLPIPANYNPHWAFLQGQDGLLHLSTGEQTIIPRRQELPPAFHRDGSVYVTKRDVLMEQNSLYGKQIAGYHLEAHENVNIDTPEDWACAEVILRAKENS